MTVTSEFAKRVVAENIDRELERLGWSQGELHRRTGISRMTVSNICSGKYEPKASVLKTIADALGVSMDALVSEARKRKLQSVA